MDLGRIVKTKGGKWRKAPLLTPLTALPGDRLEIEDGVLWQERNEHFIDSRPLQESVDYEPQAFEQQQTISAVIYFEEKSMPSVSATITNTTINQTTGAVRVDFSNGAQREFADFDALVALADGYDADDAKAQDLAIMAMVRRSPDGSNLDICNGVTCTIDGAGNSPVSYSGLP